VTRQRCIQQHQQRGSTRCACVEQLRDDKQPLYQLYVNALLGIAGDDMESTQASEKQSPSSSGAQSPNAVTGGKAQTKAAAASLHSEPPALPPAAALQNAIVQPLVLCVSSRASHGDRALLWVS